MAPARLLIFVLGAALPFLLFHAEAGEMGVNYGRVADDLPDPAAVSQLLKDNGITMVRIYNGDAGVLNALANTGIKVSVMVPNEDLADVARDPSVALDWVRNHVAAFLPATKINVISVGNEVFESRPDLNLQLVPAMTNVHSALVQLGLADAVKVTTPVAFNAVTDSSPPSSGRFRDDIAQSVMKPMLEFLLLTGSFLSMNIYPFFAYLNQIPGTISLDFALGNPNSGFTDESTRLVYHSLLDAQLDATYYAQEKLLGSNAIVPTSDTECGWSNGGKCSLRLEGRVGCGAASIANAQAYNNNLINRILSGNTGTPHRPDADMDAYIFALFNENGKGSGPDDIERHFGLFYPNMTKVYEFDFQHPGPSPVPPAASWCVANAAVGEDRLQAALDFACGHGADCSGIQPGAVCFEPNTRLAHASYAVNSYYQNQGRASGTCDFAGAAFVVFQEPAEICDPNASWCVANAEVGDDRLQAALDWACGHGADCGPIQPGASCFEPNTRVAHASYAFNSYYQRNHRASGTCDFAGAGTVVFKAPKIGNCVLPWRAVIEETTSMSNGSYASI
ncbi:hypothetical protein EJB05_12052 [Eragrostis curvula]|uniref:X8 domain-containing protein n=1 Tax=Eragrostis curvula TaxID=38414 RepID=A0A5J9VS54_9POAL|nr:hypothetical protein EJB05_12052 [Eragrostis curvula]